MRDYGARVDINGRLFAKAHPGTPIGYLKGCIGGPRASQVAALLDESGVVELIGVTQARCACLGTDFVD